MNYWQIIAIAVPGIGGAALLATIVYYTSRFGRGVNVGRIATKNLNRRILNEIDTSFKNEPLDKQHGIAKSRIWDSVPKPKFMTNMQERIEILRLKKTKLEEERKEFVARLEQNLKNEHEYAEKHLNNFKQSLENEIQKLDIELQSLVEKLTKFESEKERLTIALLDAEKEYREEKQKARKNPITVASKKWLLDTHDKLTTSLDGFSAVAHWWPIVIFIVLLIVDYYISSRLNIDAIPVWNRGDGISLIQFTIAFMVIMVFAFEGVKFFHNHKSCPSLLKKLFEAIALLIGIVTLISIPVSLYFYRRENINENFSDLVYIALFFGVGFLAALFLSHTEWSLVWRTIKSFLGSITYGIKWLVCLVLFIIELISRTAIKPFEGLFVSSPTVKRLHSHLKKIFNQVRTTKTDITNIHTRKDALITQNEKVLKESIGDIDRRYHEMKEKEKNRVKSEIDALDREIHEIENDKRTNRFRVGVEYAVNRYFKWEL